MPTRSDYYTRILNKKAEQSPEVIEWCDAFPYLGMLMAETSDDGVPRKGLSIMLYLKDGKMLCRLHDPEVDLKAWIVVDNPIRVLEEVELSLDSGTLDWVHFTTKPGSNGRR